MSLATDYSISAAAARKARKRIYDQVVKQKLN